MQHDFILLDRSGSMGVKGLWAEALGAVNGYVKKLAEDKVDTGVTLAVFDDNNGPTFDVIRDRIIPSTWRDVTPVDAEPRGMTPLNDSIGKIVALAKAGFNGQPYEKVAIIIMTDGLENKSKELTVQAARALLDECRAKNWQIIFLGADFDNVQQAVSYNNAAAASASVKAGNLGLALRSTASLRKGYADTGAAMHYSDKDKTQFSTPTPDAR